MERWAHRSRCYWICTSQTRPWLGTISSKPHQCHRSVRPHWHHWHQEDNQPNPLRTSSLAPAASETSTVQCVLYVVQPGCLCHCVDVQYVCVCVCVGERFNLIFRAESTGVSTGQGLSSDQLSTKKTAEMHPIESSYVTAVWSGRISGHKCTKIAARALENNPLVTCFLKIADARPRRRKRNRRRELSLRDDHSPTMQTSLTC